MAEGRLEARFPDRPVRYVVHSGHHVDRAGGASLFDDTAELIGHAAFNTELLRARSAGDPSTQVRSVDRSYGSTLTITLGGQRVTLVHPGPGLGIDATVLHFEAARAVFVADLELRRPTGDGFVGSKADVGALRRRLEDLVAEVQAGVAAALTLDQIQRRSAFTRSTSRHQSPTTGLNHYEHRDLVFSMPVGYTVADRGRVAVTLGAGPALVYATTRRTRLDPAGGHLQLGLTVAVDLAAPIARSVSVVLPVRFVHVHRPTFHRTHLGQANWNLYAGAGLRFTVSRRVR